MLVNCNDIDPLDVRFAITQKKKNFSPYNFKLWDEIESRSTIILKHIFIVLLRDKVSQENAFSFIECWFEILRQKWEDLFSPMSNLTYFGFLLVWGDNSKWRMLQYQGNPEKTCYFNHSGRIFLCSFCKTDKVIHILCYILFLYNSKFVYKILHFQTRSRSRLAGQYAFYPLNFQPVNHSYCIYHEYSIVCW